MVKYSAVILSAGAGKRFGGPKHTALLAGRPLFHWSLRAFQAHPDVGEIVLVLPEEEVKKAGGLREAFPKLKAVVPGGPERTDSARAGVSASSGEYVLIHDAARPLVSKDLISRVINALQSHPAAAPAVPVRDTIKRTRGEFMVGGIDRERLCRVQTPQGFRRDLISEAYKKAFSGATDDTTLLEATLGIQSLIVPGEESNIKITVREDLAMADRLLGRRRTGFGWDAHPFRKGRPLILGGVELDYEKGLLGHSDGDALCHAVADALLGAAGLGDIGTYFPDTDPKYRNANSLSLLRETVAMLEEKGFLPESLDATVIIAEPKLGPYIKRMTASLADALGISPELVSVKAKSGNRLGFAGEGRGCEVYAIVGVRELGLE
jgi:2-C-methyl-D-erythritol 4-phosphate cytidylyltransferase/2-C-methyl-D-erythritol 2,4-cyclodiphosphate synthase